MCCYRLSLKMKTNTIIYIIYILLQNLLTGALCETSCNKKGEEGLIRKENGGKVTLKVIVKDEIQEIHWIRQQTHNVFFRILECCRFEKYCCQSEDPEDCCRVENKAYETKLCSCNVSSLSSSITICNATHEDEGVFLAEIQNKHNNYSTCKFHLHIPDNQPTEPQNSIKPVIILVISIIVLLVIIIIIVIIHKCKTQSAQTVSSSADLASSTEERPPDGRHIDMALLGPS